MKEIKKYNKGIMSLLLVFSMTLTIFSNGVKAETKSVNASSYTFTYKCAGATDIKVTTSSNSDILIEKKGIILKKKLSEKKKTKSYNYTAKLSNTNTYCVTVKTNSKKKANIKCEIKQHLDKKQSSKGGIWTAKGNSPVPGSSIIYRRKIYFTKSQCSEALTYVTDAKYLDYQSKLVNGTITVSGLILSGTGIKTLTVASTFLTIGSIGYSFDFKSDTINKIKLKGNYNKKTKKFGNGVVLTEYMYNGISFIEVDSWKNNTMQGVGGYIGSWS